MGIFSIFGTSLRALNAYSGALSVVANNVANSSNENYSRQRVEFSTLPPDTIGGIETGRGVVLQGITQVVDSFIEKRLMNGNQDYAAAEARYSFLRSVDAVFNEFDGEGINGAMGDFFDSWNAVTAEPESIPLRNNVIKSGENLAGIFNQYAQALTDMRSTIDGEISAIMPKINSLLTQIKNLNQQIQNSDSDALSYQDLRRAAVNELSQYVDITTVEGANDFQIYTKSGVPLLNGVTAATFGTTVNSSNDNLLDITVTIGGVSTNVTSSIQSGRLAGLIEARDTDLANYQVQLDTLAYTLASQVNTLHTAGFDLGAANGNNFFNAVTAPANATNIDGFATSISLAISDASDLALSGAAGQVPGGNSIGLSIAGLADSNSIGFFGFNNNSFTGFFGDFMADVGSDVALASADEDFRLNILEQVKLDRTSVSGVNVDEEEINLVKFQAAFQASGRLIQIADSILETLIGILG